MTPFIWDFNKTQNYSHQKQISSYRGAGVEERLDCKETWGTYRDDGSVLKLNCGYDCMIVQIYQTHWITPLMGNFCVI